MIGNKDIDRKLLNELEDEDLVNMCQVNKKAQSICNDQVFWMNRVFLRFGYVGGNILRKSKGDRDWSEYYIKDLRKINSYYANEYLMNGSGKGKLDHVIISLNIGANIHVNNDDALRSASMNGHLGVVKYLIELKPDGANIHADDDGALRLASMNGHIKVIKYLVGLGVNIHTYDDLALRWASMNGHIEVVKYLVGLGADIHAGEDAALRYSSRNGHLDVVKYLVELKPDGANIHAGDDFALRSARQHGQIEVVKYLENVEQ